MEPPIIEHGPLTMRLPSVVDIPWIYAACQDPDVQRFTTVPSPYLPEHAVGWVTLAAELCAQDDEFHFVVSLTETGELLGSAGLRRDAEPGRFEIGYWVERDARGRGVATSAVRALEAFAATALGMEETFLRIAEGNEASVAVARRCGYAPAGSDPESCKGLPVLVFRKRRADSQPASD